MEPDVVVEGKQFKVMVQLLIHAWNREPFAVVCTMLIHKVLHFATKCHDATPI